MLGLELNRKSLIIVEIIFPGAGLKDSVSGYGPGEFVFEGGHFGLLFKGLYL
jgi:hypothetical protein